MQIGDRFNILIKKWLISDHSASVNYYTYYTLTNVRPSRNVSLFGPLFTQYRICLMIMKLYGSFIGCSAITK